MATASSYVFFLSYARGDSDKYLDRFYRDLVKVVRERRGRGSRGIGFRDTTGIEIGEIWPKALDEALSCSRVFLSLLSPAYVNSENCGREWAAFRTRLERHADSLRAAVPPLILPILWIPLGARFEILPGSIQEIQYSHADFGDSYAREGLQYLLRVGRKREYQELLTRLGQKISDLADEHGLPSTHPPLRIGEFPNAFELQAEPDGQRARKEDLLSLVETVCRLREPKARIERISGGGRSGGHLRVSVLYDDIVEILPVGAVERITETELDSFIRETDAIYRANDPGLTSILVYSGEPASEDLKRSARARRVRLMSFVEYKRLIDFQGYVARQTAKLTADPLYPPGLYIPQRMVMLGRERECDDTLLQIREWLDSPHSRFIVVLGDFGTGKTFLLHELARRIGEEGSGLIPVLVQMRALEKGRALDVLLAQHFALEELDGFNLSRFRYMLEQGRIVLLFDGFDELAVRVTYPKAIEHFDTLLQAARGAAKVVVTSRRQHFISDRDVTNALGERVESLSGHRIALLLPFNHDQIRRFLVTYIGDERKAEARLGLIERIRDLLGLSHNPRMLGFIADLPEEQLLEAEAGTGSITPGELYRLLLERWIVYEFQRVHPKGAPPGLSIEERWKAVSALAVRLWQKAERSVRLDELAEDVAKAIEALSAASVEDSATATFQIGSGTLLVRDEDGRFSFLHQSILEWLVARRDAEEISAGRLPESLYQQEISLLMAGFLGDLLGEDQAVDWARGALSQEAGEVAKKNALLLLQRLGRQIGHDSVYLEGQDLRGRDLSGQNLTAAYLVRADLSDARLVRCQLSRAVLKHARLVNADLTGADLTGADLTNADLTGARLLGADLTGAHLRDAVLHRAKLVGATVDRDALADCRTFGAALPAARSIQPFMAPPSSPCEGIAWSPEGEFLASAEGTRIRLFDAAAGREIRGFRGHEGLVKCVAFSPDGRLLAAGGFDRTVRVFDVQSGENLSCFPGYRRGVECLAFHPGGQILASGSEDGTVRLRKIGSGRETLCLRGDERWIRSIAFSPDGLLLASASSAKTIRLWDVASGAEVRTLKGHDNGVRCVAFSPSGQALASGGDDDKVRLWNVAKGDETGRFEGHENGVRCLAFSADGHLLATGSYDRTVRLWEVATGLEIRSLGSHEHCVTSVGFSPRGMTLASGSEDGTVRLFDVSTGSESWRFRGSGRRLRNASFVASGRQLCLESIDGALIFFETATGREVRSIDGSRIHSIDPSGQRGAILSPEEGVRVIDLASGREISRFEGEAKPKRSEKFKAATFSPDGKRLAVESSSGTQIVSADSGREIWRCGTHSVVFSADGAWLAGKSGENGVHIYDARTEKAVESFHPHAERVTSLNLSADGRWFATGSEDRTVRLWEVSRHQPAWCADAGSGAARAVAFSPDGACLAGAFDDRSILVFEVETGREIRRLRGHEGAVTALAFHSDGRYLASCSRDNTVRIWEVSTGGCPMVLALLSGGWVASGPDGRYKSSEATAGELWHTIALCRFDLGELDPYLPSLRMQPEEPFLH